MIRNDRGVSSGIIVQLHNVRNLTLFIKIMKYVGSLIGDMTIRDEERTIIIDPIGYTALPAHHRCSIVSLPAVLGWIDR